MLLTSKLDFWFHCWFFVLCFHFHSHLSNYVEYDDAQIRMAFTANLWQCLFCHSMELWSMPFSSIQSHTHKNSKVFPSIQHKTTTEWDRERENRFEKWIFCICLTNWVFKFRFNKIKAANWKSQSHVIERQQRALRIIDDHRAVIIA